MPRYDALPTNLPPRGLAREAAAQYIGVSHGKFDELIADGRMPKPIQIDGRKVWDRYALDKAFDALGDALVVLNPWDKVLAGLSLDRKQNRKSKNIRP
jgi:predicted DNA-binding transcriptional regulator AlpA